MNFLMVFKKIAKFLQSKQDNLFTYKISKQKGYIKSFKEPRDNIERGYYQYKCQMKLMGLFMRIGLNFLFFFVFLIILFKFKNSNKVFIKNYDAVFLSNDMSKDLLPKELTAEFPNIMYGNNEDEFNFNLKDKRFIYSLIKRYPFSWFFIVKSLLKVAMYSSRIQTVRPKAIITYSEYSFTSSILTAYCEQSGVEHINIMHGEKLYFMRDSFFRFHRFYIWDEYYKDLFLQLRAEESQFILSTPQSLIFNKQILVHKTIDYTYYLAGETNKELKAIECALNKLLNKKCSVAIRPHPRYTDLKIVNSIFKNYQIEDLNLIRIEDSISRTQNAISLYSTVLNQAYHNGVNIIIDDNTNFEKFDKLKSLQYICLNKKHKLLSKEIG